MINSTYSVSSAESPASIRLPENAYICDDGLFRSSDDYRFTHTFTSTDMLTEVAYDN